MNASPLTLVIPLGGLGQRFSNEKYTIPKPLIRVLGVPIIFWVLDNLKLNPSDSVYIPYNPDLDSYGFSRIISLRYPSVNLVKLKGNTNGATHTIYECVQRISDQDRKNRLVCLDGDTFYTYNVLDYIRNAKSKNGLFCFESTDIRPIFSYTKFDEKSGLISEIKEKIKISDYANSGCYYFENCSAIEYAYTHLSGSSSEIYTSDSISFLMENKSLEFYSKLIEKDRDFFVLGTPFQIKMFSNFNSDIRNKKLRFCFDIDDTLLTKPQDESYEDCKPIPSNISFLKMLKFMGHRIILHTARRMRTHSSNIGSVIADIGKITLDSLAENDIPFDEIYFGKPYADFYIDDKSINANLDLEKLLGFYSNEVKERDFNNIDTENVEVIRKSSDKSDIEGEIFFYENMPKCIVGKFPMYFGKKSDRSYLIEKINGISISRLFAKEALSEKLLGSILSELKDIHDLDFESYVENTDISIYRNYSEKLTNRFESFKGLYPETASSLYCDLVNRLNAYESSDRGMKAIIHGDPVFTNIMLCSNDEMKFFDMRGRLGDSCSILGDRLYDYSKVYQSLIGYDEILHSSFVSSSYRQSMITVFEDFIQNNYGRSRLEDISLITSSLLFSLIPLHSGMNRLSFLELSADALNRSY